ncbi:blue copper protein-like [Actinidia eriantha]|uniref:blue copper protein-like n=1 Tax=Actinidia eriantha TaxID=165200 RepID=UPI002585488C|nr:blue copper protein-like [Actinidia eriantha]
MASYAGGIVCVFIVLCVAVPSLATVYNVGESSGWTVGVDYTNWTSGKTFMVGDSLVFNYGSGHTVDEVSGSDYNTCTAAPSESPPPTTTALPPPVTFTAPPGSVLPQPSKSVTLSPFVAVVTAWVAFFKFVLL